MEKNQVWVSAKHEKGLRERGVNIRIAGGISAEAVVCGLRLIIELLEREDLPMTLADIDEEFTSVAFDDEL